MTPEQRLAQWLDEQDESGLTSLEIATLIVERVAPRNPNELVSLLIAS